MHIGSILFDKGRDVATVAPGTSVAEAAQRLADQRVGALVVSTDGEHIEGILSERDITWAVGRDGAGALDATVADLMTREVTTCGEQDTTDSLARLMTEQRIRHIPVVDADRIIGIVSIGDIVKHRLHELETETETLHEYLASGR